MHAFTSASKWTDLPGLYTQRIIRSLVPLIRSHFLSVRVGCRPTMYVRPNFHKVIFLMQSFVTRVTQLPSGRVQLNRAN